MDGSFNVRFSKLLGIQLQKAAIKVTPNGIMSMLLFVQMLTVSTSGINIRRFDSTVARSTEWYQRKIIRTRSPNQPLNLWMPLCSYSTDVNTEHRLDRSVFSGQRHLITDGNPANTPVRGSICK